jgi:hypothetical protein
MKITEKRLRSIIRSVIKESSMDIGHGQSGSVRQELDKAQAHQTPFASENDLAELVCGRCSDEVLQAVAIMLRSHMTESDLMSGDSQQMQYDTLGNNIPLVLSQSANIDALASVIETMKSGTYVR